MPFAITICMILVIIRMKVLSEKRKELSQTIASLIGSIRTEKGCKRCDFCQSIEDENELYLLEEWDTQENLKSHLKSERFRVLRGAMNLLKEPYEMMFHTIAAGKRERKRGANQQFNYRDDWGQRTILSYRPLPRKWVNPIIYLGKMRVKVNPKYIFPLKEGRKKTKNV